jgi:hypothetical protein
MRLDPASRVGGRFAQFAPTGAEPKSIDGYEGVARAH